MLLGEGYLPTPYLWPTLPQLPPPPPPMSRLPYCWSYICSACCLACLFAFSVHVVHTLRLNQLVNLQHQASRSGDEVLHACFNTTCIVACVAQSLLQRNVAEKLLQSKSHPNCAQAGDLAGLPKCRLASWQLLTAKSPQQQQCQPSAPLQKHDWEDSHLQLGAARTRA